MGFFLSALLFIEDRVLGYGGGAPGEGSSVRVVIRRGWSIGVRGKATRRGSSVRVVVRRGWGIGLWGRGAWRGFFCPCCRSSRTSEAFSVTIFAFFLPPEAPPRLSCFPSFFPFLFFFFHLFVFSLQSCVSGDVLKHLRILKEKTSFTYTAEPAYSRLKRSKKTCVLKEKFTTTGIE